MVLGVVVGEAAEPVIPATTQKKKESHRVAFGLLEKGGVGGAVERGVGEGGSNHSPR